MYNVCMASDINELREELKTRAKALCPSCQGKVWLAQTDLPSLIPKMEDDGLFKGRGIETLVLICDHCGFVRTHSADVLRRHLKGDNGR